MKITYELTQEEKDFLDHISKKRLRRDDPYSVEHMDAFNELVKANLIKDAGSSSFGSPPSFRITETGEELLATFK